MKIFFSTATSDFFKECTKINDFSQVVAASVWTMRWQVKGFYAEAGFYSDASTMPRQDDLKARFLAGSGLNRTNFRSLVDGQTWPDQQKILAEMTLLSFIALFEGWVDAFSDELSISKSRRDALQWPSHARYPRFNHAGQVKAGIDDIISRYGSTATSDVMQHCFYPKYAAHRYCNLNTLDDLMICYRYWKEVRNAVVHAGGCASTRLLSEQARAGALTASAIQMASVPILPTFQVGDKVSLDLFQVFNFAEALQRIVVTVDAELSQGQNAERVLLKRWEAVRQLRAGDPPLSSARRLSRVRKWAVSSGMIEPADLARLDQFLTAKYGVEFRV